MGRHACYCQGLVALSPARPDARQMGRHACYCQGLVALSPAQPDARQVDRHACYRRASCRALQTRVVAPCAEVPGSHTRLCGRDARAAGALLAMPLPVRILLCLLFYQVMVSIR